MTEEQPSRNEGGPPGWMTYLIFTAVTLCASMVGGCLNRQESRQKHEQLMGEIEKVRNEVRARGNRP